mgnify:CR=1 FL=1
MTSSTLGGCSDSPAAAVVVAGSVHAQDALAAKATTAKSMGGMRDFWNSLTIWRSCSAACLLLALVIGLQWQTSAPSVADPSYIAVLVTPEDKTPGWVIQTNQTDEMQLVPLGAIEIPKGKALQFWTKAEGWDAPISLGLVQTGESLKIATDQLPPLTENQLFRFLFFGFFHYFYLVDLLYNIRKKHDFRSLKINLNYTLLCKFMPIISYI